MSLPTASSVKMESHLHKNFQFTCSKRLTINDSYKMLWGSPSPGVQSSSALQDEAHTSLSSASSFCLHNHSSTPGSCARTRGCLWFPEHSGMFLGSGLLCLGSSFRCFQLGPKQVRSSRAGAFSWGNLYLVSLSWVRCSLQMNSLTGWTTPVRSRTSKGWSFCPVSRRTLNRVSTWWH